MAKLDAYTLECVARWHGRQVKAARLAGYRCSDVIHTFSARHWDKKAAKARKRRKV